MDEQSIASIEASGQVNEPSGIVYERLLSSGQFTSPCSVTLPWVQFVAFVANDANGVRVLIVERRAGAQDVLHEVVYPGMKVEGPGATLEVLGNDLYYTVTAHKDQPTSPRINRVVDGRFVGLAAPDGPPPEFVDVNPTTEAGKAVIALAHRGLMNGYARPDGLREFRPRNNLTREQYAIVLARREGWI